MSLCSYLVHAISAYTMEILLQTSQKKFLIFITKCDDDRKSLYVNDHNRFINVHEYYRMIIAFSFINFEIKSLNLQIFQINVIDQG